MAKDYKHTLTVKAEPESVYLAVTKEYDNWWGPMNAHFLEIGDKATINFRPNPTTWTFQAKELEFPTRVVLECIDAKHVDGDLPDSVLAEWLGTHLIWEIERKGDGALVTFVHEGLVPGLKCYEVCKRGWSHFIEDSLQSYLNSGKGSPHKEV